MVAGGRAERRPPVSDLISLHPEAVPPLLSSGLSCPPSGCRRSARFPVVSDHRLLSRQSSGLLHISPVLRTPMDVCPCLWLPESKPVLACGLVSARPAIAAWRAALPVAGPLLCGPPAACRVALVSGELVSGELVSGQLVSEE